MKVGAAFPGAYLKADDLGKSRPTVTIEKVELEEIGGEQKLVLHFAGKERGLVLNKTNANAIADFLGTDETDDWGGRRVVLYATTTDYQGKRVPCIRIAPAAEQPAQQQKQQRPAPPPPEDDSEGQADDDVVPF